MKLKQFFRKKNNQENYDADKEISIFTEAWKGLSQRERFAFIESWYGRNRRSLIRRLGFKDVELKYVCLCGNSPAPYYQSNKFYEYVRQIGDRLEEQIKENGVKSQLHDIMHNISRRVVDFESSPDPLKSDEWSKWYHQRNRQIRKYYLSAKPEEPKGF